MMCLAHVNDNHFMVIYLKDNCQIPSIIVLWRQHRRQDAEKWDERYFGRMIVFNELSWVVGYEVIEDDNFRLVENLDHEEKVAADKKVGHEVKIEKDEIINLDDFCMDIRAN